MRVEIQRRTRAYAKMRDTLRRRNILTSRAYEAYAGSPPEVREEVIASVPNVLDRRVARKLMDDAVLNLSIQRVANEELDPEPWVHAHANCPVGGWRGPFQTSEHDVFEPREGFVPNIEAYPTGPED